MARKSNALKEAVGTPADAKEVKGEVLSKEPSVAPRGRVTKAVPAVDLKAAKKALAEKQKEANTSQKAYLKQVEAIRKERTTAVAQACKPVEEQNKLIAALQKDLDKEKAASSKIEAKVHGVTAKIKAAADKDLEKLTKAKEKADVALAKEIAALEKVVGTEG